MKLLSAHDEMAKTLPWAVALHILFLGALLGAAGGGAFSCGRASGRGLIIVSLSRDINRMSALSRPKSIKPAAKPAGGKAQTPPVQAKAKIAATGPGKIKNPFGAAPANRNSYLFGARLPGRIMTFGRMRMMPMPAAAVSNPWLKGAVLNGKMAAFQASAQKAIRKMLMEDAGVAGIGALEGEKASVIISYGPYGVAGAKVSSDSGGLKTLLEGVNWAGVPLPSACGLSLKSIAIEVKVEKGAVLAALKKAS